MPEGKALGRFSEMGFRQACNFLGFQKSCRIGYIGLNYVGGLAL
jgi:hypothetical protein